MSLRLSGPLEVNSGSRRLLGEFGLLTVTRAIRRQLGIDRSLERLGIIRASRGHWVTQGRSRSSGLLEVNSSFGGTRAFRGLSGYSDLKDHKVISRSIGSCGVT